MIITRSPLRICLGGGGTDLPSYYKKYGGFLISAAISKYVYIAIHETFINELIIKYSKMERVDSIDKIGHPIIREALKLVGIRDLNLEIVSFADIPAGTGLGSSGSFTTAILRALHQYKRNLITVAELAEQACEIELGILKEPIGKQDQYISAYGGITCFNFLSDDTVQVYPVRLSPEILSDMEENMLLFFTGFSRLASNILKEQNQKTLSNDSKVVSSLHYIKELGKGAAHALEGGDLQKFGEIMHEHWELKKGLSKEVSTAYINELYDLAIKNGAVGGKVVGAGGGGFLLFYAHNRGGLRRAMRGAGLKEVRFDFDFEGTKVVS